MRSNTPQGMRSNTTWADSCLEQHATNTPQVLIMLRAPCGVLLGTSCGVLLCTPCGILLRTPRGERSRWRRAERSEASFVFVELRSNFEKVVFVELLRA